MSLFSIISISWLALSPALLAFFKGLEENEDDLYLDYTMLPSYLVKDYDVTFEEKETLFVKRWKPDALQVRPGFNLRLN